MIIKVQFEGKKPGIGEGVRVVKNGKVRIGKWRKLIIGRRSPDIPDISLKEDEIFICYKEHPIIGVALHDARAGEEVAVAGTGFPTRQ